VIGTAERVPQGPLEDKGVDVAVAGGRSLVPAVGVWRAASCTGCTQELNGSLV